MYEYTYSFVCSNMKLEKLWYIHTVEHCVTIRKNLVAINIDMKPLQDHLKSIQSRIGLLSASYIGVHFMKIYQTALCTFLNVYYTSIQSLPQNMGEIH